MNTLNKIQVVRGDFAIASVFCLLVFCGMAVYGQARTQPQPKAGIQKLTRAIIETSMRTMSDLIINGYADKKGGDSKVISSLQLRKYEDQYKIFHTSPEIEKLTGNSREWFGKLYKLVQGLNKCSAEINVAVILLQTDKIGSLNKQYEDLQKAYKDTYEKPQKAR